MAQDDLDFRPAIKDFPPGTIAMLKDLLGQAHGQRASFEGTLNACFEVRIDDKRAMGGSLISPKQGRWVVVQEPCLSRIERLIRDGQALTITGRYADGDDRIVEIVDFVDPT